MTFSVLGDSISTFQGTSDVDFKVHYPASNSDVSALSDMWWDIFAKKTGWKMVCNDSFSGARVTPTGKYPAWSSFVSDRRISLLQGDAAIVFGGTNDLGMLQYTIPYQLFHDTYQELIAKVRRQMPDAELYFCTPLRRLREGFDQKNNEGWSQHQLQDTIRTLVEDAMLKDERIHLFDLATIPVTGLLSDGLHPNRKGMVAIADFMVRHLGT
ncbi:MAG: SGNH/GDSL hydrolase family protein [Sphaerochaetaceae bacterium]|nr:SGNH/GDSL hydrolase family protein [Spirochaetales bacterium]MDY5499725.1 SGNH/GDSL hydrolase family protein [Sphaerochaetaceae bacterium]